MSVQEQQEELSEIRQLVEGVGWKWFQALVAGQIHSRIDQLILKAPENLDDVVKMVYAAGEIAGIKTIAAVPEAHLRVLRDEVEEKLEENDDE